MAIYTVHLRLHGPGRDLAVIEEGLNWPAVFFSVPWALWHRLWLVAAGFFVTQLMVSIGLAFAGPDALSQGVVSAGIAVIFGYLANDARRWTMGRRGYIEQGVVCAANRVEAERAFLENQPAVAAELLAWAA